MPLLCVDLDNTLVDRAAAFETFAHDWTAELGRPDDAAWLIEIDGDGFTPRETVADVVREKFGLSSARTDELVSALRGGLVERMTLEPAVAEALDRARAAGWTIVIVTNGSTRQQTRKVEVLGLNQWASAVVISEAAGVRKPDPEIFRLASTAGGQPLEGAWMVGDSAAADIAGAQAAGIDSIWLQRGRVWPTELPPPTAFADSLSDAVDRVVQDS